MKAPHALPEVGRPALVGLALAVVGVLVGLGLAWVAAPFEGRGPAVLVGVVAVPLLTLGTVKDTKIGVVAVFATFPVASIVIPTWLVPLQVVEAAVLAVAVIVAIRRLATGQALFPWPPALWWLVALAAWAVVALPSAIDHELALKQIASLVAGIIFAAVVVDACKRIQDVRLLLGGFVAVIAVIGAGAFLGGGEFESAFGGARVSGRPVSSLNHANELGTLTAIGMLVAVGLVLGARSRAGRIAAAVPLVPILGGQLLSLSRGSWLGTAGALAFLIVVLPSARRALIVAAVPIMFTALIIGSTAPDNPQVAVIGERVQAFITLSPYDGRDAIWREALREIVVDPVTGSGPGGFAVASTKASSEAFSIYAYHAHNIWLTWAAESGLVAALLLVAFMLAVAIETRKHSRSRDRRERAIVAAISAAFIALLLQGVIDYTLRNAVVFFAAMGLMGVLLGANRLSANQRPSTPEGRQRI